MDDLPYKIKRLRELRNYTQEYMAGRLGISQRGYSKIESGKSTLSVQRLRQIAEALECNPADLMEKPLQELVVYYFG